jgi:hypothetical protein
MVGMGERHLEETIGLGWHPTAGSAKTFLLIPMNFSGRVSQMKQPFLAYLFSTT